MVWVAAASIEAEMIQKEAFWNWLNEMLVYEPMHAVDFLEIHRLSIPAAAMGARPGPATVGA